LSSPARESRLAMRNAANYATWREAAAEFDQVTGREEWKHEEASELYDWKLVKSRLRQIRQLRADNQIGKLVHHLRQGLYWNLGNLGNPVLYGRALVGTKQLIHDYVTEVASVLDFLCDGDFPELGIGAKRRFFDETAASYGRSALMLSGGATLGLFHVGVVKALILEDLLPDVISGSSAGSVVAATVGTRSPDQLMELLDLRNAYYHFWKSLSLGEMLRKGVVMDQRQTRKAIAANIADLSFEEAYERSGRIINITVSPAGSNQPPRLLNYLTFPYLYVREAVLASSAVPFLFEPVLLMTRDEEGKRVPYMPSLRWTDGSLKSDLPGLRVRRLHNVNHFIVSQTNPHVIPFVRSATEEQGLAGNLRDYLYSTVRSSAQYALGVGRMSMPVERVRHTLDYASSILDQDYRGNITILPKISVWRYANVTANPKMDAVERFIREGERATWKRIEMIRNQTVIAQTLDRCRRRLEVRQAGGTDRRAHPRPNRPSLSVVRRNDS
jgi:TAG lipase / steryl ester hydrolase / phospholipase A2 / LPA acyltransferase